MSDNRKLSNSEVENASFWSLTAYINKVYCKKHGYDFKYVTPFYKDPQTGNGLYNCMSPEGNLRHASWSKLLSVLHFMQNCTHDFIVYIDTDCVFKNIARTLNSIVPSDKDADFFFFNDKPWSNELPCAGFFVSRVNERAKELLTRWYNVGIPKHDTVHPWEQNALYRIWPSMKSRSVLIDEWMFREDPNQFLRHIGSHESHLRVPYFRKLVQTLEGVHEKYQNILSEIETVSIDTSNLPV